MTSPEGTRWLGRITDSSLLVEIYPADKQCFGKAQGKIVKYF